MTQLWIWNRFKQIWTNGVYSITQEVVERYPWDQVRAIYFQDTKKELPEQKFEIPKKIFVEPEWTPLSIEELTRILDDTNSLGN